MMTPEEKEMVLESEAQSFMAENFQRLLRTQGRSNFNPEAILEQVKDHLRQDKRKRFHDDEKSLFLTEDVGELGAQFGSPKTRDDMAVYETSDRQMVKRGAWRVAD